MVSGRTARVLALALAALLLGAGSATSRTTATPAFPVTIAAANGKVTLDAKPVRIVSLSPSATEDLFAIGAGPQVVAVDDQSNYPTRAPRTKLSGFTPNVEAIAGYRPDLVVASGDAKGLLASLGKLHIPVLLEPAAANMAGVYAQIRQLGRATGRDAAAARLVKKLRGRVKTIVGSLPRGGKKLSVYHELGPDFYSATSKTFIGRVYGMLGLRNIADAADRSGSGYPKLSAEYIVGADPDLIVLSDTLCCGQNAAKVQARPGWSGIAAVTKGGVVGVSDDVASRWGPRIVDFMGSIAAAVRAVSGK
jgi:iron complex transport system substrate-binding protein